MRAAKSVSRVLTLLAVLLVAVMLLMDAAEATRGGRRSGGDRRGRGRDKRLPLRGLEKCLCGKNPTTPECNGCFNKLRNETMIDWAAFGNCLNEVENIPMPSFNSTCVGQNSSRRHH